MPLKIFFMFVTFLAHRTYKLSHVSVWPYMNCQTIRRGKFLSTNCTRRQFLIRMENIPMTPQTRSTWKLFGTRRTPNWHSASFHFLSYQTMTDARVRRLLVALVETYILKWKIPNWVFEVRKIPPKCEPKFTLYRSHSTPSIVKNMINQMIRYQKTSVSMNFVKKEYMNTSSKEKHKLIIHQVIQF